MGSAGVPFGIGALHLWMGVALAVIEMSVTLTVLGTALFGNQELSRRAFTLLRFVSAFFRNSDHSWPPVDG
jgi:hypothetical protein